MLKTEDVEINGNTYRIGQLPLGKARPLLVKLLKLAGPAIGEALASAQGEGLSDIDLRSIGNAVKVFAFQLEDAELKSIQDTLFDSVSWQNEQGDFVPLKGSIVDNHFAGELGLLFKVIAAALKVNFGSTLKDLGLDGLLQTGAGKKAA